jgi:hypothetical protein
VSFLAIPHSLSSSINDSNHPLGPGMDVNVPNLHRLLVPPLMSVKGLDQLDLGSKQLGGKAAVHVDVDLIHVVLALAGLARSLNGYNLISGLSLFLSLRSRTRYPVNAKRGRLKGSTDSVHYLERDELAGLKRLHKEMEEPKAGYVFVNERGQPFARMGIARMIERSGDEAKIGFPVHVHMLRHSTGYALANKGMDTRRLQHFLGHASITNTVKYTAMSPEPFKDIWR